MGGVGDEAEGTWCLGLLLAHVAIVTASGGGRGWLTAGGIWPGRIKGGWFAVAGSSRRS